MSSAFKTSSILHAYVLYTNRVKKLISTESIEGHVPKDEKDFRKGKKYKIWFNGYKGRSDILLNAYILLLGGMYNF